MFIFCQIFVKLAGNQDRHKISDKFKFRPDWISHFGVMHPWGWINFSAWLIMESPRSSVGQSWSNFICDNHQWEKGCFFILEQMPSKLWLPWQQKAAIDLYWGKRCLYVNTFSFDPIVVRLAGNENRLKISEYFKFWPDQTPTFGIRYPWASKKFPIDV